MQFRVEAATDIGRRRSQNQDSITVDAQTGLFMVADGMGGHKGGEIASAIAVDVVATTIRKAALTNSDFDSQKALTEAITAANYAIFERSHQEPALRGMGTTTTALLLRGDRLVIGHVGDSRCYFIRPQALWQATRDHSLVQEKLRAGLITRDEVKTDRLKNVITRSVGFEPQVMVETYEMKVQPRDVFVICSDGLSGAIEDDGILEIIQRDVFEAHDVTRAVADLIETANNRGGDDNISAIVVEITG